MKHFTLIAGALAGLLLASAADADSKGKENHGKSHHDQCGPGMKGHGCDSRGSAVDVWKNRERSDDNDHKSDGHKSDDHTYGRPYAYDVNHWARHTDDDVYYRPYSVGHALPEGYIVMFDPSRYPSWESSQYVRYGAFLYLIDRLTGRVVENTGPVQDWNWDWRGMTYQNCPPGLAKKNPPCIPPGQVRNGVGVDPYRIGDRLPSGYDVILNPPSRTQPDHSVYARSGDMLYRIAPDTGIVQQEVGEVGRLIR